MLESRGNFFLDALIVVLGIVITGCATPRAESNVVKSQLPSELPKVHRLNFEPSPSGFPLRPSRETAAILIPPKITIVDVKETDTEARAKTAAEQNPRLREELGERFAFFETESFQEATGVCPSMESEADQDASSSGRPPITRLTYFSYSRNTTIMVCMQGEKLVSVGRRAGYQPPESDEEMTKAMKLAREDPRLSSQVENLTGRAILIEPESGMFFGLLGDLGGGNRVLWVTFSKQGTGDPRYWAVVDLTEEKVLDAGKEEEE